MRTGFGLPGLAKYFLAYSTRWKGSRLLAQAPRFFGKVGFEGMDLFETSTMLHDTLPCALRVLIRMVQHLQ